MAFASINKVVFGRQKADPGFQSFVSLFNGDNVTIVDNSQPHENIENVLSAPEEAALSSCSSDNGWLVVSAQDPILSLASDDCSSSGFKMSGSNLSSDSCGGSKKSDDRLCGYLNKYKVGGRNLPGGFKRRWFIHADSSCKLLYYRSPNDQIPLGEIDVASATLSFNASTTMSSNIFEIRTNDKTYMLQAEDQHTMHYWLQELQMRRKVFHKLKSQSFVLQAGDGLLKDGVNVRLTDESSSLPFVDNITMPSKTVGVSAALSSRRRDIRDLSIVNWKTEIRNMIAGLRGNQLREMGMTSPTNEEPVTTEESGVVKKVQGFGVPGRLKGFIRQKRAMPIAEGTSCTACKQLNDLLKSNQEEARIVDDELLAAHELINILQKQVDKLQLQLETQTTLANSDSEEKYLEALKQKDIYIVELEHYITLLQRTLSEKTDKNELLEVELATVREDITLYQENLHVKDGIVKTLSLRLADLQPPQSEPTACSTPTAKQMSSEIAQLKDQFQDQFHAYKMQNAFLNQEIMELNQMFRSEEVQSQELKIKLSNAEARNLQLKSKYLYCLKEMMKPQSGNSANFSHEVVDQLLQDAMGDDKSLSADEISSITESERYDAYGFDQSTAICDDVQTLADSLLVKSHRLIQTANVKSSEQDVSKAVQWEKFLISCKDKPLSRSVELKQMIRDGIHPKFRSCIWKECIDNSVLHLRQCCGSQYYKNLTDRVHSSDTVIPARHQVQLDLLRTLPNNQHYANYESDGVPRLRNVLLAFSLHKPDVGYCQGMNRLAAILLLFLSEEDAFWGLVAIIENIMPRQYYDRTLIAAHADQRVLKEIVAEKLPQLHAHFVLLQCDFFMFTFNWFLVLFVDNLPVETYLRIWDTFLYEGTKVLFRYAVAILKYCETDLLSAKNSTDLNSYMRNIGNYIVDAHRLSQIAFSELNPFPMKTIEVKRQTHMQKLQAELCELVALRDSFDRSVNLSANESLLKNDVLEDDQVSD